MTTKLVPQIATTAKASRKWRRRRGLGNSTLFMRMLATVSTVVDDDRSVRRPARVGIVSGSSSFGTLWTPRRRSSGSSPDETPVIRRHRHVVDGPKTGLRRKCLHRLDIADPGAGIARLQPRIEV